MSESLSLRARAGRVAMIGMLVVLHSANVSADTRAMTTVRLPRSVELQVPEGWLVLSLAGSRPESSLLTGSIDVSMNDLREFGHVNLFAANSQPAFTYASIRIDSMKPPSISMAELRSFSGSQLSDLSESNRRAIGASLLLSRRRLLEFDATRLIHRGGFPALVTRYVRSGAQGPVVVRLTQIFTPTQEIQLFLTYRLSERETWESVIEQIYRSVTVNE